MNIKSYFDKYNINVPKFSEDHGLHRTTVYKWLSGEASPRPEAAKELISWSNGEITFEDIYKTN